MQCFVGPSFVELGGGIKQKFISSYEHIYQIGWNDKRSKLSKKDRERACTARGVSAEWNNYAATLGAVAYKGQFPNLNLLEEPKSC